MSKQPLLGEKPPAYSDVPPTGFQVPGQYGSQQQGGSQYPPQPPYPTQQSGSQYPPQPPYPTQPGYQAGAPPGYQPVISQPSYMGPHTTITVQPQPSIVVVGGCPACRVGVLEDDFTCLGVCLAIFCFPIGLLCCLAMRQRRCPHCGAVFS